MQSTSGLRALCGEYCANVKSSWQRIPEQQGSKLSGDTWAWGPVVSSAASTKKAKGWDSSQDSCFIWLWGEKGYTQVMCCQAFRSRILCPLRLTTSPSLAVLFHTQQIKI